MSSQESVEKWLPIPGYEDFYEISDHCRVRRLGAKARLLKVTPRHSQFVVTIYGRSKQKRLNVEDTARSLFGVIQTLPKTAIADLPGEIWRPVPDFEKLYEISNKGRVRRLAGIGDDGRHIGERLLHVTKNNGYLVAWICRTGERQSSKKLYVESMVESLFGEPLTATTEMKSSRKSIKNRPPRMIADLPNEEWRNIPNYSGIYQVSSMGRVRSMGFWCRQTAKHAIHGSSKRRWIRPHLLKGTIGNSGYRKVELVGEDGSVKTIMIHRLVATTFIPNPEGLECVHHKDENKANARLDNLEWTTRGGNVRKWFGRRNGDVIKKVAATMGISEDAARSLIFPKDI